VGYSLTAVGVIAFHEKAGRSQEGFVFLSVTDVFLSRAAVATLPSALLLSDLSLGASWVFTFQPGLPTDSRPRLPAPTRFRTYCVANPELSEPPPVRKSSQLVKNRHFTNYSQHTMNALRM
jgi:hypothetical protein